jgi:hypothetical protein
MIVLKGLDSTARYIEVRVKGLIEHTKKVLAEEVNELQQAIDMKFSGDASMLRGKLEITRDGDTISLSLPYIIGTSSKGKPIRSVRKQHNPHWTEFNVQPFQKAMEERGYTNIHPVGDIEPSGGKVPNIRITANLPADLIRRMETF